MDTTTRTEEEYKVRSAFRCYAHMAGACFSTYQRNGQWIVAADSPLDGEGVMLFKATPSQSAVFGYAFEPKFNEATL